MAEAKPLKRDTGRTMEFSASDTIPAANLPARVVISPSQITADQDNYSPTDWATADTVRLDFDANGRAITGLAAWTNGGVKTLVNISDNYGYLPCEHPDSTAANRIAGVCDHILPPKSAVQIVYDDTTDRVRVVSNPFNPAFLGGGNLRGMYYQVSAASQTAADWGDFAFNISGTGATLTTVSGSATIPAGWSSSTGTTAAGAVSVYFAKNLANFAFFGASHIVASFFVRVPTLSDGAQTFSVSCGLVNGPSSVALDVNNSVVFKYSHGLNSGKWLAVSRDNAGAETTADTGVTVATTAADLLTISIDKARSEARYYINGVMVARITGNMPNSVMAGCRATIVKTLGTTARTLAISNLSAFTVY
jgi:hypothetical protein